ncbi:hypothetical protein T01_9975 [Trichinella spiralis]|uniref:Uncharacterized protein n=1 Tax=Trichinella spiralis TaxID=6334 RepID=A0A0V1AZP0_TRISP|nr:hypothetical protein T01_9975 [Trichinella spiralis]
MISIDQKYLINHYKAGPTMYKSKLYPVPPLYTLISNIQFNMCCLSVPNVEIFANLSSISKTTIGDAIKSMSTFFFIVVDVEFDASLNLVGSFTRLVTRMRPMALQLPYRLNKSDRAES